jgi:biotin carboxyl carrier protein
MKDFKFKLDGKAYEVSVEEKENNIAEVTLNGEKFTVEVEGRHAAEKPVCRRAAAKVSAPRAEEPAAAAASSKPTGGKSTIKSPLPGNIFKVVATQGQAVKKGALLFVIESMKMENNILASRDGVVKAIHVAVGQNVLQGDALIDIE